MSSTCEIQFSDAEIKALEAEIQGVSKLVLRSALQTQISLIKASANASPVEILRQWLSRIKLSDAVVKINASETTISQITEVFDLKFNQHNRWTLVEDNLLEVPSILNRYLRDLQDALYDEDSEATCRITVDIILIQCRKYLRHKYLSAYTNVADATNPSTPKKAVVNMLAAEPMKGVKLFPECSISVEMPNKLVLNGKFLVTGRADWTLGYGTVRDEGTLLIAMEAKQRSKFSEGEAQLIAYLAILRENRLRAKKTNIVTQGFYSDGTRFVFICITADGVIEESTTFDIDVARDLKIVFSFIVAMMETAMKSTPNATPTKPGQLQDKEVNHFEDEVWSKIYAQMDATIAMCSDDDMEDIFDASRI